MTTPTARHRSIISRRGRDGSEGIETDGANGGVGASAMTRRGRDGSEGIETLAGRYCAKATTSPRRGRDGSEGIETSAHRSRCGSRGRRAEAGTARRGLKQGERQTGGLLDKPRRGRDGSEGIETERRRTDPAARSGRAEAGTARRGLKRGPRGSLVNVGIDVDSVRRAEAGTARRGLKRSDGHIEVRPAGEPRRGRDGSEGIEAYRHIHRDVSRTNRQRQGRLGGD